MGLPIRTIAPTPAPAKPTARPTRGQLQVAATRFAKILDQNKDFAKQLFEFAIGELGAAWALLAYSHLLVRCQRANLSLEGKIRTADALLSDYEEAIQGAKEQDETNAQAARTAGKGEVARDLLLEDMPEEQPRQLSGPERQVIIGQVRPMFNPPKGTGPAKDLGGLVVGEYGRNLALAFWLIETFSGDDELAEFNRQLAEARTAGAKDAAAARREAAERLHADDGEIDGDAQAQAAAG